MNASLTISLQNNLLDIVQVLGEPDAVIPAAVRQYVVDRCLQKLDVAEARIADYVRKYGSDYERVSERASTDQMYLDKLNRDYPLWEADAVEWQYRLEEVELWRTRLTRALHTSLPWPVPA